MKFVTFLRNVNLGQLKGLTRAQLEAAFLEAKASETTSCMRNGTLAFPAAHSRLA
jgi:uncharacterized protein (DUF1697 family)